MNQSNEPDDSDEQMLCERQIDRQISLNDLQLRVQLLGLDLEQPTLEELGKLIREHRCTTKLFGV
jgi:hypothetical protein